MRSAARRRAHQQAALAEAMFAGSRMDGKDLQKYCDDLRGEDRTQPPEALPGAIDAAARGHPVMTWKEFLAQRNT
ncbi:hypothetical protein D1820_01800 [Phaeobacter sp. LSS9]|uniref:hypothetical protein n=1 Tax=Phaeobacter TaxID=302485 RepID=UPI000C9CA072|nr:MULTISPECIES: hypothetical protein [Phaeobacter]AXT33802.1 hypothetical protein D1820_01800 [Phaeobacter sp. LSS9]